MADTPSPFQHGEPPASVDPNFVDWAGYLDARYTPSPALMSLPDYDSFWRTLGGSGFGFDELQDRAVRAAGKAE